MTSTIHNWTHGYLLRAIYAVLLASALSACAHSQSDRLLPVNIPNDCDRNADPVRVSAGQPGYDIRALAARYAAGLGLANKRLVRRRTCEADIRARYAK